MEGILAIVAIGLSFIFVFVLIIVFYVRHLIKNQMKAVSKQEYLKSHLGEGN